MTDRALAIARTIVDSLEKKKAEDILLIDLIGVCSFTDYFVICTGSSERALKSLADEVKGRVKEVHVINERSTEGDSTSGWVLIDYGDVILHLFSKLLRKYYQLEELWSEGKFLLRFQ
ncbi:MAG: ribosome silencing factor [Chloroflexi bacterium]|nr:ribosome silencing factor [Chloroflexota bacterium]